jgi:hypothetical protein
MRLPADFADLEQYADIWALPDSASRGAKRRTSTMEEIRRFYDAAVARIDPIMTYLNRYQDGPMPGEAICLLNLALALAEVSRSVEQYGAPGTEGLDESRFELLHEPKWPGR